MSLTIARFAAILGFGLLASCDATGRSTHNSGQGATAKNAPMAKLSFTSTAFENGALIPREYTCDGADQLPSLSWGEPPHGTMSFAIVTDDPDAPAGIFRHWGVFDIPASTRSIGGNHKLGTEIANDFGTVGYGGPCPPKGKGPHHYHFKLFALDIGRLGLRPQAGAAELENVARKHALAQGELVGIYERK